MFSNNSESDILGELGANSSLRFLGPDRGVLPIGPNSIPGLDTLQHSPLSDAATNAAILSYNYTLNHQGVSSNINCINDTQSPVIYSVGDAGGVFNYLNVTSSCNELGLTDINRVYQIPLSYWQSTLASWACYSEQNRASYIYIRGYGQVYEEQIGNLSCSISPILPAVVPVTYHSTTHVFSTLEGITTSAAPSNFLLALTEWGRNIVVNLLIIAQNHVNNLVAESVRDLGIQALGVQPPNDQYLPFYEAMMQGIMAGKVCTANIPSLPLLMVVLQVTSMRFLYSMATDPLPPASCIRTVDGTMDAEVIGWVAKPVHIAFLMPMTILNLTCLIIALISMARGKRGFHELDPTDPRSLVLATSCFDEGEPSGWADGVSYRSREVRECHIRLQS